VAVGQLAFSPGLGWLAIQSVRQVELSDLSADDANADGFESREQLIDTLRGMYPDSSSDGKRWFLVGFLLEREQASRKKQRRDAAPSLFNGR
jgi:hypothetical protein